MSIKEQTAPMKLIGRRILVAEDEYFIADDIARALTAAGAQVVGPVSKLDAGLDLLATLDHIDGAVLDINLRGDAAYPLAQALRFRNIPFCFATGYDGRSLPTEYRDVPCWTKPFDVPAIVAGMANIIAPRPGLIH